MLDWRIITMMRKVITFLIFALLVVVALLGVWYAFTAVSEAPASAPPLPLTSAQQVQEAKRGNAASLSPQAAEAATHAAAARFAHTYKSSLGFSFGYPDSLKVGAEEDSATGATTITVQDASSHVGFQISVRAWDGTDITAEKINADLPEIGAHSFQPVSLDGTPGLAFAASDAFFGESIQIWLIRGDLLYQMSTYATQGPLLSKVLGTWKWEK